MANHLLRELKNDDEALALLSALGCNARDYWFIEKIGGALRFLMTDVFFDVFFKKSSTILCSFHNLRALFDEFYESGGFLISIAKKPSSSLFRYGLAPLVFFGRYDQNILDKKLKVAVVGSRVPSLSGLAFTEKLSRALSENDVVVVSGGAMGIDSTAHRAAHKTIVVSGLRCDFKKETRFLDRKNLAIIYPFGPFLPQGKYMFLERNRYVAALACAVVIVQGKRGSGTFHTANVAKSLGIPIFVVPGAVDDPLAFVPNHLLEMGEAKAMVDVAQFALSLVTNLNIAPKKTLMVLKKQEKNKEKTLPYLLQLINDHQNNMGFDELLAITKKSFADLQRELLDYEMAGRVVKRGSQFVLTGK